MGFDGHIVYDRAEQLLARAETASYGHPHKLSRLVFRRLVAETNRCGLAPLAKHIAVQLCIEIDGKVRHARIAPAGARPPPACHSTCCFLTLSTKHRGRVRYV